MKKIHIIISLYCLFIIMGSELFGQLLTRPIPIGKSTTTIILNNNQTPMQILTNLYHDGEWDKLKDKSIEFLEKLFKKKGKIINEKIILDFKNNYYLIVFISTDIINKPEIIRFVLHDPISKKYSAEIPGISKRNKLFHIYLSDNEEKQYECRYLSTKTINPLITKLPKIAAMLDPKALAPYFGKYKILGPQVEAQEIAYPIHGTFSMIVPPYKRSSIRVEEKFIIPDIPTKKRFTAIGNDLKNLKKKLCFSKENNCEYLQKLTNQLFSEIIKQINSTKNCSLNNPSVQCWVKISETISNEFKEYLENNPHIKENRSIFRRAMVIEAEFLNLFREKDPSILAGEFELLNIPPDKIKFGFVNAIIPSDFGDCKRIKLNDDGKLTNDFIKRQYLLMLTCNYYFLNRYPYSDRNTFCEKLKVFVGLSLVPEFGFGGGIGLDISNGLSINFGWTALWAYHLKEGDQLYTPPRDPNNYYDLKLLHALFVGLGYDF